MLGNPVHGMGHCAEYLGMGPNDAGDVFQGGALAVQFGVCLIALLGAFLNEFMGGGFDLLDLLLRYCLVGNQGGFA